MTFADWLMKLALVTAPENRSEWAHAMSAEFGALEEGNNHIAWASGCLGSALTWRLQVSAVYLLALVALPVIWNVFISTAIFAASTSYAFAQHMSQQEMGQLWMAISGAGNQSTLFLISASLCACRPRYAVVSVIVLWLSTTGALFVTMFGPTFAPLLASAPFSSENNNPALPNVVMAFAFAGADMWPVVLGGFAGWAFVRGKTGTVIAAGVLAFAFIFGFTSFFSNPGEASPVYGFLAITAAPAICAGFLLAIVASSFNAARDLQRAWRAAG